MRRLARLALVAVAVMLPAMAQSWKLLWSDEFDGAAGTGVDRTKWTFDLGGGGWGNQELEIYTNSTENSRMDGAGHLAIRAISTGTGYTSARLKTQGLFNVQYGRVEARIRVPKGQGIWPAFWMLGQDITTVGWPACGEIDIMENIGKEPATIHGSLHGPGYSGGNPITATYPLPGGAYADGFHTFAVQWSAESIAFSVDGAVYQTVPASSVTSTGKTWAFNKPFFIILNVAVGGTWPGRPDATTSFPQEMLVDYVRVYQQSTETASAVRSAVDAASFGESLAPGSLATLFGNGMALATSGGSLFDTTSNAFVSASGGTSVLVNGQRAPLVYVSPGQVNFQVPWESLVGQQLNVEVEVNGVLSNALPVKLQRAAPSLFAANGTGIATCVDGGVCSLWGNGFGPTNPDLTNGAPAPVASVTGGCSLSAGGQDLPVLYCGAAPGTVIYQLNFRAPSDLLSGVKTDAVLRVNGVSTNVSLQRI